ncbi:MAG TPA: hypothetical protein VK731_08335 [Candidatus Cybelea sp.]|nr:hypothetical protein [Candidatus Cybelea sp.]
MPIDRSQYQIELTTSADTGGMDKAVASAQQAREAFQFLRDSAAETLGAIGELIHLLDNPFALAVAGATLATKMLAQELQAARAQASGQIKHSTPLHDDSTGRGELLQQTQSPNDSVEKNERAPKAKEPNIHSADEEQSQAAENTIRTETAFPQRLGETPRRTRSSTSDGGNAEAFGVDTTATMRGSITRAQQRLNDVNPAVSDHPSSEEVAKLIELNDFLLGLEENQATQHGRLLDKIDSMISRVQALESAQRNTRWQSQ